MRAFSNFMSVLSFSLEPISPHKKNPLLPAASARVFDFPVPIAFLLAGGSSGKLEALSVCTEDAMELVVTSDLPCFLAP